MLDLSETTAVLTHGLPMFTNVGSLDILMYIGYYVYHLLGHEIFFFLLALQPPVGVVFYSPLVGFSLLAYEVS